MVVQEGQNQETGATEVKPYGGQENKKGKKSKFKIPWLKIPVPVRQ